MLYIVYGAFLICHRINVHCVTNLFQIRLFTNIDERILIKIISQSTARASPDTYVKAVLEHMTSHGVIATFAVRG